MSSISNNFNYRFNERNLDLFDAYFIDTKKNCKKNSFESNIDHLESTSVQTREVNSFDKKNIPHFESFSSYKWLIFHLDWALSDNLLFGIKKHGMIKQIILEEYTNLLWGIHRTGLVQEFIDTLLKNISHRAKVNEIDFSISKQVELLLVHYFYDSDDIPKEIENDDASEWILTLTKESPWLEKGGAFCQLVFPWYQLKTAYIPLIDSSSSRKWLVSHLDWALSDSILLSSTKHIKLKEIILEEYKKLLQTTPVGTAHEFTDALLENSRKAAKTLGIDFSIYDLVEVQLTYYFYDRSAIPEDKKHDDASEWILTLTNESPWLEEGGAFRLIVRPYYTLHENGN